MRGVLEFGRNVFAGAVGLGAGIVGGGVGLVSGGLAGAKEAAKEESPLVLMMSGVAAAVGAGAGVSMGDLAIGGAIAGASVLFAAVMSLPLMRETLSSGASAANATADRYADAASRWARANV